VQATIVTGVDGARLVLTARNTGQASSITVRPSGGDGGLARLTYDVAGGNTANYEEIARAQNSQIRIDGHIAESSSNSVSTAIAGVTITAIKPSALNTPTTLRVSYDTAAARKSIDAFVAAYNNIVKNVKSAASYDVSSKIAGPLFGDTSVRDVSAGVRQELSRPADGNGVLRTLTDIGISSSLDGTLSIDGAKLDAAIGSNFDAVGRFFAGANGLGQRFDTLIEGYTKIGGLIELRTKGLDASLVGLGTQRTVLTERLAAFEKRLRAQYNALDTTVAQLRSTASFLTQQLVKTTTA
jgi:flagellar hook-associated protein 2